MVHDEINQWQHLRPRHKPLDVHIVRQLTERSRLAFRAPSDQDVDVE